MRQSPLANIDSFRAAAASSSTIKELLQLLGLRAAGGNFRQAHVWSEKHGIPLPIANTAEMTKAAHDKNTFSDDEIFCENSTYSNRTNLKNRLRKTINPWICAECRIGEEWNGKSLVLQLDHINGIYNDNRKENLRLLCPNCHSQTETFCGRNLMGNRSKAGLESLEL